MNSSFLQPPLRLFRHLKALTSEYGPAWLLIAQLMSWLNLAMVYVYLRTVHTDVPRLVRAWNLGRHAEQVAETGGTFAMAVVLNKLISPMRFVVCILILRRTAPQINRWIDRRWATWRRWRGKPTMEDDLRRDSRVDMKRV
ncbi:hypothetical protein HKX48_004389 [Thoreauomyces humboldtii]|nr:hypothetical protein HKX48_004389 [Thoreauomyces humboldtii]